MNYFKIIFFTLSIIINISAQSGYEVRYENRDFLFDSNANISQTESSTGFIHQSAEYIISPITDPDPFLGVAFRLYGTDLSEEALSVEIKSDAEDEWLIFSYDDDSEKINGELISGLLFLDKDTKKFQFRINSYRKDANVSRINFTFISPGKTPENQLEELKAFEPVNFKPDLSRLNNFNDTTLSGINHSLLSYPRPPFVTRTQWGCPQGQGSLGSPALTTPTHLIVHHSAGANTSSDWPAVVRSIYTFHTQSNGWSDIGYNWLIDPNGVIYQGRAWYQNTNDNVTGAHFCGYNSRTMGVCVMGTYTSVSPTESAKTSLTEILAYKADEQNIDPLGTSLHLTSGLTISNISGHRNGCSTECPGTNLYNQLPQIRSNVNALLNPTSVNSDLAELNDYYLKQNYPNPFNPSTVISWQSPVGGRQTLKVYDVLGNEIATLVDEYREAGRYEVEFQSTVHSLQSASGIYFYQLSATGGAGSFMETKKMILLR